MLNVMHRTVLVSRPVIRLLPATVLQRSTHTISLAASACALRGSGNFIVVPVCEKHPGIKVRWLYPAGYKALAPAVVALPLDEVGAVMDGTTVSDDSTSDVPLGARTY